MIVTEQREWLAKAEQSLRGAESEFANQRYSVRALAESRVTYKVGKSKHRKIVRKNQNKEKGNGD